MASISISKKTWDVLGIVGRCSKRFFPTNMKSIDSCFRNGGFQSHGDTPIAGWLMVYCLSHGKSTKNRIHKKYPLQVISYKPSISTGCSMKWAIEPSSSCTPPRGIGNSCRAIHRDLHFDSRGRRDWPWRRSSQRRCDASAQSAWRRAASVKLQDDNHW